MSIRDEYHFAKGPAADDTSSGRYHYRELAAAKYVRDSIDRLFKPGQQVLDVDCGLGQLVTYMAAKGIYAIGVESSELALSLVQNEFVTRGITCGSALNLDIKNLPFQKESLDGFVAMGVLEHYPEHRQMLEHWTTLLKPGGRALLSVPNGLRLDFFFYLVAMRLFENRRWVAPRLAQHGVISGIYDYEERWWPSYFRKTVKEAGLRIDRYYSIFPAGLFESLLLLTGKVEGMSPEQVERMLPKMLPESTGLLLVIEATKAA